MIAREKKQLVHGHHIPSYHPPPLPPLHRAEHHHHHHTVVDHTITLFSILLVLGGIFVYLHSDLHTKKLEGEVNANNNTKAITIMTNASFDPDIDINLNTTSDSDSSADTSSSVSINGTFPVFVYENGTIVNVTFIPVYPGFGWPFLGGGFGGTTGNIGGTTGNIGRSLYDNLDDMIQGFTNMIQNVDYE